MPFSPPPHPQNLRGVDFDVAIVDEAAFVNSSLLREGVFPVLMKKRAACWMATTPSEKLSSLFMELIRQVDDNGDTLMNVVRSGQPCKSCMKTTSPWTCKHTLDERDSWKDGEKEKRLRYLYAGAADTFAREQLGAVIDDSIRPFRPKYVLRLQKRPPIDVRRLSNLPCVFLLVDPASGGACEFAVIVVGFLNNLAVVRSRHFFSFLSRPRPPTLFFTTLSLSRFRRCYTIVPPPSNSSSSSSPASLGFSRPRLCLCAYSSTCSAVTSSCVKRLQPAQTTMC